MPIFAAPGWTRDHDAPCLSLGPAGAFDDSHIFAPCVAMIDGRCFMWYCGSRNTVEQRVFAMGLATSDDGRRFERHPRSPVLRMPDREASVLTPTVLRHPDGSLCREGGRIRLWFSSCNFPRGDGRHTLHHTASTDGLTWDTPSDALLDNLYAPTILKEGNRYRLWHVDVQRDPWSIRHAHSNDGLTWQVNPDPVVVLDQPWEHQRLFYPTVLVVAGRYVMFYGSYSHVAGGDLKTALGIAESDDGLRWRKRDDNPVFGPDPARAWESHFTTSQSILPLADGSWRLWYATRPRPPFVHKYFAIGTARWAPGRDPVP